MRTPVKVSLSIAGSDSGGGAGIQADLAAFSYFNVFGTTAITAVTAQNPAKVTGIEALSPSLVEAQIRAVCSAFKVDAIKTGMLFSAEIIETVCHTLDDYPGIPLVVDPVMVATSGARLLRADAENIVATCLAPRATLLTPNLPEAEILLGRAIRSAPQAAAELAENLSCDVVLKGGHADSEEIVDYLATSGTIYAFSAPRKNALSTHGTGCSLSAAVCARLALGDDLPSAFHHAKAYVLGRLGSCRQAGENTWIMQPPAELPLEAIRIEELSL